MKRYRKKIHRTSLRAMTAGIKQLKHDRSENIKVDATSTRYPATCVKKREKERKGQR